VALVEGTILKGTIHLVKWGLAFPANQAICKPFYKQFIRDFDVEDVVNISLQIAHHAIERDGLLQSSWKTVQNRSARCIGLQQTVSKHRDRNFIRNQSATENVALNGLPQFRLLKNMLPKQITRGNVGQSEFGLQKLRLGTFPRTGSPQ
jgi:hypothetical protein